MKPPPVNKETHIQTGKFIKVVLASAYDHQYKPYAKQIIPGSIHEIVDRPSRRSRKNGDMGVWVDGTDDEKVFIRFFGYSPYFPKVEMTRTAMPEMRRTISVEFKRIRK